MVVSGQEVRGPRSGDAAVDDDVGETVELPPDPLMDVFYPAAPAMGVQHGLGNAVTGHHPGHRGSPATGAPGEGSGLPGGHARAATGRTAGRPPAATWRSAR